MRAAPIWVVALLGSAGIAAADTEDSAKGKSKQTDQVVLLNATGKIGDTASVDKIRRVLDTRGILLALPEGLAATLDGRAVQVADVDAIRDAVVKEKYEEAIKLLDENEGRLLQNVGGDPLPALAELSQWRALVASGQDDKDTAVQWFRAAMRFNPMWTLDRQVATPKVLRLVAKAKKPTDEIGRLRIDVDPGNATVQIDGGKTQSVTERITLPIGQHLVTITAEGRKTYSELVEITTTKAAKVAVTLDPESKSDRAARLVDATVAAPPGQARLKKVKGVSRFVGAAKFLVIEDVASDRTFVRVYDVDTDKVSRPIDLEGTASSAAIARKVLAALDSETMLDPKSVMVVTKTVDRPQRWYERWYVWVGIGAVIGGGALLYRYETREPTSVRF